MQCIDTDGNVDGELVLEKIVHSLINPRYLKDISYTGKGKQKERKVALCKFIYVLDFIKSITFKADRSFSQTQFNSKLIYGILKIAPSKYGTSGKSDVQENVEESSPPSIKESESDIVNSTLNIMPTLQFYPTQGHHQLPNHQRFDRPPIVQPTQGHHQLPNHQQFVRPPIAQPSTSYEYYYYDQQQSTLRPAGAPGTSGQTNAIENYDPPTADQTIVVDHNGRVLKYLQS